MAAKTKGIQLNTYRIKPEVNRPGVHAKTKSSKNKNSKNYVKPYRGQGK
jgi:hypothetical protein